MPKCGIHKVLLFLFLAQPLGLIAQPFFKPIQQELNGIDQRQLISTGKRYHSVSKSYLSTQFDSVKEEGRWERRKHENIIMRKLRNENLIRVNKSDFYLTIDPLFNFEFGRDSKDTSNPELSNNTRGFLVQGAIGKKLAFYTSFYENQSFFPKYLSEHIDETGVVPGQGRTKTFKETGYDYAMASGAISYSPWKWMNVQFGHGKNFIGDGYRSLILSDNTFNYPYLKTTMNFFDNRLQYELLYNSLIDLERLPASTSTEAQFKRNAGTFHSLSYSPNGLFELSLVEGIVYSNWDSSGTRPLPWNYYMPVIGLNTGIEGYESSTAKVISGVNVRINAVRNNIVYGQFVMDHFDADFNYGYQVGIASYDAFTLKNLDIQLEWNNIPQDMYKHQNDQLEFKHYGEYLAHPSGRDLSEIVGILRYRFRDFFISGKWVYSGRNSLVRDELANGVSIETLREEDVFYQDYAFGYLINPRTNMKIKLGYISRELSYEDITEETGWYYISFITDLKNVYYDF